MSKSRQILLISIPFFVMTVLLSVAADRGGLSGPKYQQGGVYLPPKSRFRFQTPEFDFTANINSLGFRDREFDLDKEGRTRILAFGDSYTYVWGVGFDESWPKLLEARLRQMGHGVVAANLGQPGASPTAYAANVDKAVPVLKPALVIAGILQGEDLAQLGVRTSGKGDGPLYRGPRMSAASSELFSPPRRSRLRNT